jgi:cell wall-associated NlpC family hydrolase
MPEDQSVAAVSGVGIAAKAVQVANAAAGNPYLWGGKTTAGFDCSGFVSYVFSSVFANASASYQMNVAAYRTSILFDDIEDANEQAGDIVIFPASGGSPNHIGIVLDSLSWIGSQSSTGAKDVKFSNPYWRTRARKIRRPHGLSTVAMNGGRGILTSIAATA